MICKSCGRANEQGAKFCKSCGAPLEGGADVQQNNKVGYQQKNMGYQQYDMSGNMNFGTTRMTKEEFNQCANIKTIIKNITIAAIITYVIGAISLITNVILGGNIFGLLDVIENCKLFLQLFLKYFYTYTIHKNQSIEAYFLCF